MFVCIFLQPHSPDIAKYF